MRCFFSKIARVIRSINLCATYYQDLAIEFHAGNKNYANLIIAKV